MEGGLNSRGGGGGGGSIATANYDSYEFEGKEEGEGEGEGKKQLWNKVKRRYHRRGRHHHHHQLVEYDSLPEYLKDNEYILGYYRSEWPLKQIFLSIFSIHNETLNVWTHLIGFFIFLALTIYTALQVPNVVLHLHSLQQQQQLPHYNMFTKAHLHNLHSKLVACLPSSLTNLFQIFQDELRSTSFPSMEYSLSNSHFLQQLLNLSNCLPSSFFHANHTTSRGSLTEDLVNLIAPLILRPISRWPFFAFLGGAMFCLLASSVCHLFSCHSRRVAYIMLRLDYAGIAALISTSFYPPVYYSFMCNPFFCNLYLGSITVLGIATIAASLSPTFQNPEYRSIRAGLFFGMGMSGVVPVVHKLIAFRNHPEAIYTTGYEILMGALYGIGALVYATRIPERWMPGKFDIAGHSHQLFHVLVVAGAFTHYRAGLIYLKWRDLQGC